MLAGGESMKPSKGMVVSAHPLASEAGASILKKGGNAIDAAIATSLMLGVVEPAFSGIGGGGFAIVRMSDGESVALDYRETAPSGSSPDMFADGSDRNMVGPLAIATPGLLGGHAELLNDFGTMKFADLAAPAVEAARTGVASSTLSSQMLSDKNSAPYKKITRFQISSEVFVGKRKFPLLANTLVQLYAHGPQDFYHGHFPLDASKAIKELGGMITEEDIRSYAPKKRKPVTGKYMGLELMSMPPPSAGGTLLIHGLQESLRSVEGSTKLRTAMIVRSMLREKPNFGDPDFTHANADSLTARGARKTVDDSREMDSSAGTPPPLDRGSTSHFSVIDKKGNVIAVTETIECYYGSGVTIPGAGVIMNDEMHDFDVAPGRPNSIAPLKRPASSMTPTIVMKDDEPYLALGGAGSERIITSVFQTIRNVVEDNMSLNEAVACPRLHFARGTVELEQGDPESEKALNGAGFKTHVWRRKDAYFGGVQAIMVDPETGRVSGAADPRRKGAAAAV